METDFNLADATERSRGLFAMLDADAALIAAQLSALSYRAGVMEGREQAARLLA